MRGNDTEEDWLWYCINCGLAFVVEPVLFDGCPICHTVTVKEDKIKKEQRWYDCKKVCVPDEYEY